MNRKKRNRRRLLLLVLLAMALLAAILVHYRYAPYVRQAAKTRVTNAVSNAVNEAVDEEIVSDRADYSGMVVLEKDATGAVTAVRTDMAQANLLKSQTMERLDQMIEDIRAEELSISLGSVLLPEFFSGRGPRVPVRIVSMLTSDADFYTQFSQAGINQTLQRITMTVKIKVTLMTPVGTQTADVSTDTVVAETVIVGTVPDSYFQLD
jgi:sporulation protein YunB